MRSGSVKVRPKGTVKCFSTLIIYVALILSSTLNADTDTKTNHISLPSGPGSLEGLGKTFEPSLNTGGASYSVDIAMPAAAAGYAPKISLNYSSGFGMGIAGLGWQISLPIIERSLENGQPAYAESDVLTYQGETLVALTDATYAPEIQTSFIRFTRAGNRFVAIDKAGNTLEFGSVVESQSENIRATDVASTGPNIEEFKGTYRWYLKKSTNAKGQFTEYFYNRPSDDDGVIYLSEIRYGSPSSSGPVNRVEFNYEERDDQFASYQAGFRQLTKQRLKEVSVFHGSRKLWSYELSYEYSGSDDLYPERSALALDSGFSLLKKVTRWNADKSASLPPIRFDYSRIFAQDADIPPLGNFPGIEDIDLNANGQIDRQRTSELHGLTAGVNVIAKQASFTDVTGDGLADWLFWKNGQYQYAKNLGYAEDSAHIEFSSAKTLNHAPVAPLDDPSVHLIDLDGDGQSDFLHRISETRWLYYRNRGNGQYSPSVEFPNLATIVPGTDGVQFADLNMDSRIDILSSDGRYWRYCLNGPKSVKQGVNYGGATYDQDLAPFDNFPSQEDIDLNGNGTIDIPGWECSGSITTGLPAEINLTNPNVRLQDMNGDRLKDVVWMRAYNGTLLVTYWPTTGLLRFAEPISFTASAPELDGLIASEFSLDDINGDGLADLVYQRTGQLLFWLQRFSATGARWSDVNALAAPTYSKDDTALMKADVNGNGTQDFAWVSVSGDIRPTYLDISGDQKAHILSTIDNGMGLRTVLGYQSMGAMQAEADRAGMPWDTSSPIAQQIVSQRTYHLPIDTTGSGENDEIIQTYRYRDAYYDPYKKQFRGFGFARVETLGDSNESTQVSRHFFHTGAADGQDNDGDGLVDERELDGTSEEQALKGKPVRLEQTNKEVALANNEVAQGDQLVQAQHTDWRIRRIHSIDTAVASMSGKEVSFAESATETTYFHELTSTPQIASKQHTYDDWGNVTQTIDFGLLSDPQDNKTTTTEFAYHSNGIFQLPKSVSVTDLDGNTLNASKTYYDNLPLGQLTRGLATSEEKWVKESEWKNTQQTQYDAHGNPIVLIDGDGRRRQLVWDTTWHAFPTEEWIYAEGTGKAPLRTQAAYDTGLGVLKTHTGFNGESTRLAYDDFGRLVSIQKPYETSPSIQYSYHFIDAFRQHEYRFSTNEQARTINATDTTSFVSTVLTRDDGQTEEVKQHIDGLGRELATYTKFENGYIVTGSKWFDHQGRDARTFRPWTTPLSTYVLPTNDLISTDIDLDAHGRPLRETLPADNLNRRSVVQYQYLPREVRSIDPDGYEQRQTLNAEDKILTLQQQHEINNAITWETSSFEYDPLQRLTKITDAHNNQKQQRFNGLDQKVWQSDLDQGVTLYRYDTAGNLLQKTDQMGRNLYYRYDQAARLKQVLSNDYNPLYTYHYDQPRDDQYAEAHGYKGKLSWVEESIPSGQSANNPGGTSTNSEHYHYDLRGNLIHKTRWLDGISYQFHFQYDAQDRIRRQIWPDGDHIDYRYDLRGKINGIGELIDDIQYDPAGQVSLIQYANGTGQTRDYDDKGQLTQLDSSASSGSLQQLSYQYDLRGNMTRSEDLLHSANTQSFKYDPLSQLRTATGKYGQLRYQYDAIGNMTAKYWNHSGTETEHNLGTMSYGGSAETRNRAQKGGQPGPHAITASLSDSGSRAWQYNAIGQRTQNNKGHYYQWDQLGRLTRWQKQTGELQENGEPVVAKQENYTYDYKGRRLKKATYQLDANNQLVPRKTAYYVDSSYEVRDDIAQKHISIGNLRVARLETPIAQALAQIKEYSLTPGWNQIFLSHTPNGNTIWQQLQSDDGEGGNIAGLQYYTQQIVTFDAKEQDYEQHASGAGSLSRLEGNHAYWVKIASDGDTQYPLTWRVRADNEAGDALHLFAKRLHTGWNHTQLPLDKTLTTSDEIQRFMAGTAIERIWYYQQAQDRWYYFAKGGSDNTLAELSPDAIYWVYSTREHIVSKASGINSQKYYLHNNHLGSVAFESDEQGNITESSQYQPYGASFANTPQSNDKVSTYSFSGKELDGSGLYYFEARYYDPVTTRFISPDPLFRKEMERCVDSLVECNLYQYAANNPLRYMDLTGQFVIGVELQADMTRDVAKPIVANAIMIAEDKFGIEVPDVIVDKLLDAMENGSKVNASVIGAGAITAAVDLNQNESGEWTSNAGLFFTAEAGGELSYDSKPSNGGVGATLNVLFSLDLDATIYDLKGVSEQTNVSANGAIKGVGDINFSYIQSLVEDPSTGSLVDGKSFISIGAGLSTSGLGVSVSETMGHTTEIKLNGE